MTAGAAPAVIGLRPILVTGGAGFIGCNLVDRLARDGHHVLILDALVRPGVERNMDWLRRRHPDRISFVVADVRDDAAVVAAASAADAVFHLAGQVAVTTSLVEPREDFEVNVAGTLRLLEALRHRNPGVPLIFASTNKVYGDLADVALEIMDDAYSPTDPGPRDRGIGRERSLDFHTPYGCSKGAADQYVLDYARSFGLPTAVLRMSCIYGPHQMGTEDQGWVAHFLIRALAGDSITIFGDGRQVRDILFVDDAVEAYLAAWRRMDAIRGQAFNLGGGPVNAVSLRQLIRRIEDIIGRKIAVDFRDWRAGDQRYYVSDAGQTRNLLGLGPPVPWRDGLARLADWYSANPPGPAAAARAPPAAHRAEAVS